MNTINSLAGLLVAAILAVPATAQQNLSQIESSFETAREPLSQSGPAIPRFDPLNAPPAASSFTFTLGGVRVVGNTVFTDGELAQLYAPLVGRTVSVAQVFALADQITTLYGNRGYPLSRAIVPAQDINASGVITLQVVEGFIDEVIVDPDARPNRLLDAHAQHIQSERPIRAATLERHVLLADDLPGIGVESVLRRSEDTLGGTTVLLEVEEQRPFSFSVTADNRGSEAAGPVQLDFVLTANNLLHNNSRTTFRFVNASASSELMFGTLEHLAVLNAYGTSLTFGAKFSASAPGTATLRALNLQSEAATYYATLRHPIIRSRQRNLEFHLTFEARNSETRALGAPINRDRIRSIRLGADFDSEDGHGGLNTLGAELSFGLAGLGANANSDPLNSRAAGLVNYSKVTLNASRTQKLEAIDPRLSAFQLHVAAKAQIATAPLLSAEECGVGGPSYGRAFNSSTLSGDNCFAASAEIRYAVPNPPIVSGLQLYGFYDFGLASNLDPGAAGTATIQSAGIGARFGINETFSGSIELAKQLQNSAGAVSASPRLYVSLRGEF